MPLDTDWANPGNYTQLITNALNEYFQFIPRDIFIAFLITVITIGIYLSSDGNLKLTLGFLLIVDFFFATVLYSGVLYAYFIVSIFIGAGLLYKTYFGGTR